MWVYSLILPVMLLLAILFLYCYCRYCRKRKLCWLAKNRSSKLQSKATPGFGLVSVVTDGAVVTERDVKNSSPVKNDARKEEVQMQETVTNVIKSMYPALDLSTSGSESVKSNTKKQ